LTTWVPDVSTVCATNGVEHERMALRRLARVYAMCVQLPAQFEKPGEVTALCEPTNAVLDVGRYPSGIDETAVELAAIINSAPHLSSEADGMVMVKKFAKVLVNLGNTADAACGFGGRFGGVVTVATEEAKRAYELAGVIFETAGETATSQKARHADMRFAIPEGDTFLGGSTWQSIAKGASSVETDYFNGEIVLLGRLHGMPTPANEFLQDFANRMLHEGIAAGSMTPDALEVEWQEWATRSPGAATAAT
jgi:2-dehydropantoate 2-reductase